MKAQVKVNESKAVSFSALAPYRAMTEIPNLFQTQQKTRLAYNTEKISYWTPQFSYKS
jgi:hypothetical protein